MTFQSFSLHPQLLEALEQHAITTPTPIQAMAIGPALEGRDLQACAQTGTGKTLAFLLPTLHKIATHPSHGKGPCALVLVPTRELAQQVAEESAKFSQHLRRVKTVCIYGGMPYQAQKRMLSRPYEVLVATPGRLIDWIEQGVITFDRLKFLILDEADRMLDMGFSEDVQKVSDAIGPDRQTLLFSATLKGKVLEFSQRLLNNPQSIATKEQEEQAAKIEQHVYYTDDLSHKNKLLNHLLGQPDMGQTIIFTGTKSHADLLADELNEQGFTCSALHGDMNQRQRTRTLDRLRDGKFQILIATDVAARGVHIQDISHVINFDLPFRIEDYVHRIGRTGRAGAHGIAITFASAREYALVRRIQQYTGREMLVCTVEGMEPRQREMTPRSRSAYGSGRSGGPGRFHGPRSGAGRSRPGHRSEEKRAPRERFEERSFSERAPRERNEERSFSERAPRERNEERSFSSRPPRERSDREQREGDRPDRERRGASKSGPRRGSEDKRAPFAKRGAAKTDFKKSGAFIPRKKRPS